MTAIQRTIECLAREVGQVEKERDQFEQICSRHERRIAALIIDLASSRQRVRELESLACANPACQLHQVN